MIGQHFSLYCEKVYETFKINFGGNSLQENGNVHRSVERLSLSYPKVRISINKLHFSNKITFQSVLWTCTVFPKLWTTSLKYIIK